MKALNDVFRVDIDKCVKEACLKSVEASITQEESREFYQEELKKISHDTLHQDVEWSSLRLEQNQLITSHHYDLLTGHVKSFSVLPSPQVLVAEHIQPLDYEEDIDEILAEVMLPDYQDRLPGMLEDNPEEELADIRDFIDSSKRYAKH